jgi:ketosteroid isomerase-like protein
MLRAYSQTLDCTWRDTAQAMSQENVEVVGVRTPVAVRSETRRRKLDERILVRIPSLARMLANAWSRLPPRSCLRRSTLALFVRRGCEAVNRRDFEVLFLVLDPDIEFRFAGAFVLPDLPGVQRGHEGYRRLWEYGIEVMGDLRLEIDEVTDYGDRLINAGRQMGHGSSSGVAVNQVVFQLLTLRRGLVVRQEDFTDRDKALEAAGLRE